jgi:hypothetical protein
MKLLGARYYDSSVGRFLSADPIGIAGGINQFAYVGGDPVNGVDPAGLAKIYIGYKTIPLTGNEAYHTFVLVVDEKTGKGTAFRGGPVGPGSLGKLVSGIGDWCKNAATDYPVGNKGGFIEWLNDDKPASTYIRRFTRVSDAIDKAKADYPTLGVPWLPNQANSNSFTRALFEAGLGLSMPEWSDIREAYELHKSPPNRPAPGWGRRIPGLTYPKGK